MSLKDLAKKAGHLAVAAGLAEEDEADKQPAPQPPHQQPAHPAFNLTFEPQVHAASGLPFAVPAAVVLDEGVYQSVLAKTNFDDTPAGKAIHKYFDALDGSGLDTATRFKSAMKQAAALDGVTPDKVLAAFDDMEAALEDDAAGFDKVAQSVEAQQITSRQQKLQDIAEQAAALEQQRQQVGAELAEQQQSHANAVAQYGLARQRRASEIQQQKAQFAALLK